MNLLKRQLTRQGAALKRFDPSLPIVVHTDWSSFGIGCILAQTDADGKEYMVACSSRSLNKAERNYASYHGEMLAVLAWLMSCRTLTGQHARWALSIQDYDFDIRHRPVVKHQNADALSRCPLPTTEDGTGARLDEDAVPAAAVWVASCGLASALLQAGGVHETQEYFLFFWIRYNIP